MNQGSENEHEAVESDQISVEEWLAIRKKAALEIDAETAEISSLYGPTIDPYGVYDDLTEEEQQRGKLLFARSPGSEIWVSFRDLPPTVLEALWERIDREAPNADDRAMFLSIFQERESNS